MPVFFDVKPMFMGNENQCLSNEWISLDFDLKKIKGVEKKQFVLSRMNVSKMN